MGRAMRKRVLGHMWTAKAKISLRIRAFRSGPLLSAKRIIRHFRLYYAVISKCPEKTLPMHKINLILCIFRMLAGIFSLGAAQVLSENKNYKNKHPFKGDNLKLSCLPPFLNGKHSRRKLFVSMVIEVFLKVGYSLRKEVGLLESE